MGKEKNSSILNTETISKALEISCGFSARAAQLLGVKEKEIDEQITKSKYLQKHMEKCLAKVKEIDGIKEEKFLGYIKLQKLKYAEIKKKRRKKRRKNKRESVGKDIRKEIIKQQNGACAICKNKIKHAHEIDHIIPVSKGGTQAETSLHRHAQPEPRGRVRRRPDHPCQHGQSKRQRDYVYFRVAGKPVDESVCNRCPGRDAMGFPPPRQEISGGRRINGLRQNQT